MFEVVKERRKYSRKNLRIPVQYKSLKLVSDASKGALTRDIGEGGIRFIGNEFISLSNRLILTIILPAPFRSVKAISKVAWIRKVPMGEQYEIGNQFLNLSKDDKKHLRNCVERAPA